MKMNCYFVSTLVIILISIECSQQSDRNLNEAPIPIESRSLPGRPPSGNILGYSIEQLGYIRLIPRTNDKQQFEFRRYVFPANRSIVFRVNKVAYGFEVNQEYVTLSTSNGDVLAILDYSGILRGIFRTRKPNTRAKINMISGAIDDLSADEIRDCPVGKSKPIFPNSYIEASGNHDSLQSRPNPHFERDHGSPASIRQHTPDRTSLQEPSIRDRSRSPLGRPPVDRVLGCELSQLGYLRLIPRKNKNKRLEFRRYVFPAIEPLRFRLNNKMYVLDPNPEYIVLSASNGDVYAILEHSGILRGIFRTQQKNPRVKINMISGAVDNMTPDEIRDCPMGKNHPIFPTSFMKAYSNQDSLQPVGNSLGEHIPGSSSTAREHSHGSNFPQKPNIRQRYWSPLDRRPSHKILGFDLEKLGYIRLIPQANPNQQFEFRRNVFPVNKQIQMLQVNGGYSSLPNVEYIVLSTSNGDVFAILENTGILRGIYAVEGTHRRIKINMMSGAVEYMTATEMEECHVGESYPVFPRWFDKIVTNVDSLQHAYH